MATGLFKNIPLLKETKVYVIVDCVHDGEIVTVWMCAVSLPLRPLPSKLDWCANYSVWKGYLTISIVQNQQNGRCWCCTKLAPCCLRVWSVACEKVCYNLILDANWNDHLVVAKSWLDRHGSVYYMVLSLLRARTETFVGGGYIYTCKNSTGHTTGDLSSMLHYSSYIGDSPITI